MITPDSARVALAGIRLFNGAAALVAPRALARRLGAEGEAHGATVHVSRMFGIRTVLIALDLLSGDPAVRRHAARVAIVVHASDTASAAAAGLSRRMPPRAAVLATGISAFNVVLAAIAHRESGEPEKPA